MKILNCILEEEEEPSKYGLITNFSVIYKFQPLKDDIWGIP